MHFKFLPLLALIGLPSLAHPERWQAGLSYNTLDSRTWEGITGTAYSRVKPSGEGIANAGLQLGCRVWDLDRSDVSVTLEHQFRARHRMQGLAALNGQVLDTGFDTWRQSTAPGVQWNAHRTLDFGFGLQYRFTRLESDQVTTRNDRPWANAHLGYTFKNPHRVRPFVALRWSVALTRPGRPAGLADPAQMDTDFQKRMLRYLEGSQETSLQAGIRF